MTFEEIWQKLSKMSNSSRKQLAYEMALKSFNVANIFPHYYNEAKAIHDIEFFEPNSQYPIEDKDNKLYTALKDIMEDDKEIHVRVKRFLWLPRFINDWRESENVKSYICSRYNGEWVNRWYRILPDKSLAGERPRTLFLWDPEENEIVYKITGCKTIGNVEELTFQRMEG